MDKNNNIFLTGIVLFGAAFLFSLSFINEGLFHYDSVILAKAVEDVYRTGHLQPTVNGRYGIVIINSILYFPFYLLGQNADLLTRLSSILFYSLSIPVFFLFINDLFQDRIQGFFAAILLALTPFYLGANTYGKEHGMCMFFFLCSMILVNRGAEAKRPATLVLASLFFIFALSVRESVLLMIPYYCWLYFKPAILFRPFRIDIQKERLNGQLLLVFALPLGILFGFMIISYLGPLIQRSVSGDELSVPHFCGFFSKTLQHAFKDLWASFPAWFLLMGIGGAVIVWHARRYFLLFFFLVWACMFFIYGNFDSYVARYLDMPILAVHAFVSCFLAWVYRRFRISAIVILALLITMQLILIYPTLEFRHRYDGSLRMATFAGAITPANAVFIVADESPFIEYYGKRKTISYPIGHWESLDIFFHEIENLMDRQIPVYIIPPASDYLLGGTIEKSKFLEVSPHGCLILSMLINKGVLKDVSSTKVSFQMNNELKMNSIRDITKGDFNKIWTIFLQAIDQNNKKIWDRYNFYLAGNVLWEDYHQPEPNLGLCMAPIFKLGYSEFTVDDFTADRTASGLLKVIIHDTGIPMPYGKNDLERLNSILRMNGLYKKFSSFRLPHLEVFLKKPDNELTTNELMIRNWLVLKYVYPKQCPKHQDRKI